MPPDDTVDLLKIKIEKAKRDLPLDTVNAIDAVDWREAILGLRDRYGYTFEQLGDLELETELLLCGLVSPASYPKELETRMQISKSKANELVNEMNELVFKKIREELIKNTERKKIFANKTATTNPPEKSFTTPTLKEISDGIKKPAENVKIKEETLPIPDLPAVPTPQALQAGKLEISGNVIHPILAQKFSGPVQSPVIKTEHTLENITKTTIPSPTSAPKKPAIDPYREIPE